MARSVAQGRFRGIGRALIEIAARLVDGVATSIARRSPREYIAPAGDLLVYPDRGRPDPCEPIQARTRHVTREENNVASVTDRFLSHPRRLSDLALIAIVAAGGALRGAQYLSGRSLWHDEALLSLNIVDRPIDHVLGRLEFAQAAPWVFVAFEWVVGHVAGYSEESLRFLPSCAGIAAVGVFAALARRVLDPWPAAIAVLTLALANGLIYYSSEFKPYSSDVLVTCVLLLLATSVLGRTVTTRQALALGAAGLFAMSWSYPSVFVGGGATVAVLASVRAGPDVGRAGTRVLTSLVWCVAIAVLVVDAKSRTATVRDEFGVDSQYFASTPATGPAVGRWLDVDGLDRLGSELFQGLGLAQDRPLSHISKLVAVAAVVGLLRLARRRPTVAILVALPFLLTLLASQLRVYPIIERTTLFLLPCLALLVAEGIWLPARIGRRHVGVLVAAASAGALLAFPVYSAAYHVIHPRAKEEIRPLLDAVGRAWEPGDTLYLHAGAQYAFRYYAECGCLGREGRSFVARLPFRPTSGTSSYSPAIVPTTASLVVIPRTTSPALLREEFLEAHGRFWFVYSHVNGQAEADLLEQGAPRLLDDLGRRLLVIRERGARAYLYEVS